MGLPDIGASGRRRGSASAPNEAEQLPTSPRSLNRQAKLHRLLKQLHSTASDAPNGSMEGEKGAGEEGGDDTFETGHADVVASHTEADAQSGAVSTRGRSSQGGSTPAAARAPTRSGGRSHKAGGSNEAHDDSAGGGAGASGAPALKVDIPEEEAEEGDVIGQRGRGRGRGR